MARSGQGKPKVHCEFLFWHIRRNGEVRSGYKAHCEFQLFQRQQQFQRESAEVGCWSDANGRKPVLMIAPVVVRGRKDYLQKDYLQNQGCEAARNASAKEAYPQAKTGGPSPSHLRPGWKPFAVCARRESPAAGSLVESPRKPLASPKGVSPDTSGTAGEGPRDSHSGP